MPKKHTSSRHRSKTERESKNPNLSKLGGETMLRIEQMEGNLVVIDVEINGVKFHGIFEPKSNIDESTLKPMENGFKMEIGLDN